MTKELNNDRLEALQEAVDFVRQYLNPRFWSTDTHEPIYTIPFHEFEEQVRKWGLVYRC